MRRLRFRANGRITNFFYLSAQKYARSKLEHNIKQGYSVGYSKTMRYFVTVHYSNIDCWIVFAMDYIHCTSRVYLLSPTGQTT